MAAADDSKVQETFRNAMRRFATTVTIISVQSDSERHGTTATAVTSVSFDPPSLLLCINQDSRLHGFLHDESRFCVNFLHTANIAVSRAFSSALPSAERFEHGDWQTNDGLPYLADAQANLFCSKELAVPYGSHTIFIGRIFDARVRDDICPLLYGNGAYIECAVLEAILTPREKAGTV